MRLIAENVKIGKLWFVRIHRPDGTTCLCADMGAAIKSIKEHKHA